jgi:hypothetical protein
MRDPLTGEATPAPEDSEPPAFGPARRADETSGKPPDHRLEMRRAWVAANRERVHEMNRRWRTEHLQRARQANRNSARRVAARNRRRAELRAGDRERAKRWREAHPERVRESQRDWVKQNREKVRAYQRRYYEKHREEVNTRAAARRDADPDRVKQASRHWAERNKERRAELQRQRRNDPEAYRAVLDANAAAKRLKMRLERAGLPPKRLHPTSAAERRANGRDADAYFSDPDLSERVRQRSVLTESLVEQMRRNGAQMQEFVEAYAATRERLGLPRVRAEDVAFARAIELVIAGMRRTDFINSRDVAAAVRAAKAAIVDEEREQQVERLVKALVTHVGRNATRLAGEATMEALARRRRGISPRSEESLVLQVAVQEVAPTLPTSRLTPADLRRAARLAMPRVPSTPTVGASASGHDQLRPPVR